jgi:hypothetical protein
VEEFECAKFTKDELETEIKYGSTRYSIEKFNKGREEEEEYE